MSEESFTNKKRQSGLVIEEKWYSEEEYFKIAAQLQAECLPSVPPCYELEYCPYGDVNDFFPHSTDDEDGATCQVYGNLCPHYILSQPFSEKKKLKKNRYDFPKGKDSEKLYIKCENIANNIPPDLKKNGMVDPDTGKPICAICEKVVEDVTFHMLKEHGVDMHTFIHTLSVFYDKIIG